MRASYAFVLQKNNVEVSAYSVLTPTFIIEPDLLCSAEFTSRYPETNEKVFSELMANEVADEWTLEPSIKSKKVRIDGVVRVSKKFYKRNVKTEFVEVRDIEIPF